MNKIYRLADETAMPMVQNVNGYENVFIPIDYELIGNIKQLHIWKPIIFMKLFVPYICEDDYAVYLDADTEVKGDISELFNMNFEDPLAMAEYPNDNMQLIINSGVIVFNCKEFKKRLSKDALINVLNNESFIIDECVISRFFPKHYVLENKWNRPKDLADSDTRIIHNVGTLTKYHPSFKMEISKEEST